MEHVRWLAEPTLAQPDRGVRLHRVERRRRRRVGGGARARRALGRDGRRRDRSRAVHRLRHDPPPRADQRRPPHDRVADRRRVVGVGARRRRAARARSRAVAALASCSAASSSALAEELRARRMAVSLGALLADVPHSRPVQIIGTASDPDLIDRFELQRSRYEGPTGIVGVLQRRDDARPASRRRRCGPRCPQYAAQIPSPKAALALVDRACALIGSPAPVDVFASGAAEYDARVAALIADDDDLVEYVSRLESLVDDEDDDESHRRDRRRRQPIADGDVDPDELVAEVERFLRDRDPANLTRPPPRVVARSTSARDRRLATSTRSTSGAPDRASGRRRRRSANVVAVDGGERHVLPPLRRRPSSRAARRGRTSRRRRTPAGGTAARRRPPWQWNSSMYIPKREKPIRWPSMTASTRRASHSMPVSSRTSLTATSAGE